MASRIAALGLAALVALAVPVLVPGARAHCQDNYPILFRIPNCTLQAGLEAAIDAANAASDGTVAYVLTKDKRFHPDVVTIMSGGTVVFVNSVVAGVDDHDPRASGPCTNVPSPLPNPEACVPTWLIKPADPFCFDVLDDTGSLLKGDGARYPVTFRYTPSPLLFEKSFGYLSGTPVGTATGAQPFQTCQSITGYPQGDHAVIAYHCGIHGIPSQGEKMRGVIRVVP